MASLIDDYACVLYVLTCVTRLVSFVWHNLLQTETALVSIRRKSSALNKSSLKSSNLFARAPQGIAEMLRFADLPGTGVTWLIRWVPWLIRMCDMTHGKESRRCIVLTDRSAAGVLWLIYTCNVTRAYQATFHVGCAITHSIPDMTHVYEAKIEMQIVIIRFADPGKCFSTELFMCLCMCAHTHTNRHNDTFSTHKHSYTICTQHLPWGVCRGHAWCIHSCLPNMGWNNIRHGTHVGEWWVEVGYRNSDLDTRWVPDDTYHIESSMRYLSYWSTYHIESNTSIFSNRGYHVHTDNRLHFPFFLLLYFISTPPIFAPPPPPPYSSSLLLLFSSGSILFPLSFLVLWLVSLPAGSPTFSCSPGGHTGGSHQRGISRFLG